MEPERTQTLPRATTKGCLRPEAEYNKWTKANIVRPRNFLIRETIAEAVDTQTLGLTVAWIATQSPRCRLGVHLCLSLADPRRKAFVSWPSACGVHLRAAWAA